MITHNTATWFKDKEFYKYFEGDFPMNKMGTLKFPKTYVMRYTTAKGFDKSAAANAMANMFISAIVRYKYKQLNNLKFHWLTEGDTMNSLRNVVCSAVQFAALNGNVWENVNSSTMSTGAFSISTGSTAWLLSSDMIGHEAWTLLQTSNINHYKVVEADSLSVREANGNIRIIGKITGDDAKFVKEIQ